MNFGIIVPGIVFFHLLQGCLHPLRWNLWMMETVFIFFHSGRYLIGCIKKDILYQLPVINLGLLSKNTDSDSIACYNLARVGVQFFGKDF